MNLKAETDYIYGKHFKKYGQKSFKSQEIYQNL